MSHQEPIDHNQINRLQRLGQRMRLVMMWENLLQAFWPIFSFSCLFIFLALVGGFQALPPLVHGVLLAGFAGALLVLLFRAVRHFQPVDDYRARRRIEEDFDLANNPFSGLDDQPFLGDQPGHELWLAHRARQLDVLKAIKGVRSHPVLAKADPLAFRWAALLLLVIGFVVAGDDRAGRLQRAFVPDFDGTALQTAKVEAWITPPVWLGKPPQYLSRDDVLKGPMDVPEGSGLLVQITDLNKSGDNAPVLINGKDQVPFQSVDDGGGNHTFKLERTITSGDALVVRQARRELVRWPIRVIPDTDPMAEFLSAPTALSGARFRLDYEGVDDQGIKSMTLLITHQEDFPLPNGKKVVRYPLPMNGMGKARIRGQTILDYSEHPWAGTPVFLRLEIRDLADKTGLSDELPYVLPERIFNHPVARDLVALRKKLSNPQTTQTAAVIRKLNEIAEKPDHFFNDPIVFLAINVAGARLVYSSDIKGQKGSVQKLLWDTAIRIEDGEISVAERALKDIQQRLQQALQNDAPKEEVERLMDELQAAMDNYFRKLARSMKDKGRNLDRLMKGLNKMGSSQMQAMLERARNLARTGARDAAMSLLADLNHMLNQVQNAAHSDDAAIKAMEKMDKALTDLQGIRKKQKELLDRNYQQQNKSGALPGMGLSGREAVEVQSLAPPEKTADQPLKGDGQSVKQTGTKKDSPSPLGGDQRALRNQLGQAAETMKGLFGQAPDGLAKAGQAMGRAEQALTQGRGRDALPHQAKALESLQQSLDSLAREMAKRFSGSGQAMFTPGQDGQQNRDPFGRPGGSGQFGDGDVRLPGVTDTQRAWKILNELRRRLGDHDRSRKERDYLDRLLRQF